MNRGSIGIFGNEKAMTMIEILVVCVIMGIAFLGVAGLFPLGTRNLSESRDGGNRSCSAEDGRAPDSQAR